VLVPRTYPPSGGFRATQLDNIGELTASGLEVGVRGMLVNRPGLSVDLFANTSFIRQEVTDMGGAPPLKIGSVRYRIWLREGYAPGAMFGPKIMPGDFPIDTDGDGEVDSPEQLRAFLSQPRRPEELRVLALDHDNDGDYQDNYLGKPTPDWQGAFGGTIGFLGSFELSTLFEYKAGDFVVHNLTDAFRTSSERNVLESAQVEATLRNPASTVEERVQAAHIWATRLKKLSPFDGMNEVEAADFIRWREASLTYNVPRSLSARVGAQSLAFTLSGRNLMLWTKYSGIDPETNATGRAEGASLSANFLEGIDAWGLPLPRRISLSARVGF